MRSLRMQHTKACCLGRTRADTTNTATCDLRVRHGAVARNVCCEGRDELTAQVLQGHSLLFRVLTSKMPDDSTADSSKNVS